MIILKMKKTFLYLALASIALVSCKDDEIEVIPEIDITTQNTYDDQAAQEFLKTHYFDSKGNLKDFVATDTVNVKLADLVPAPVVLPSGVIYVFRPGAQPDPGTVIGDTDVIRLMSRTTSYVATSTDGVVKFASASTFKDGIAGAGVPEVDPNYYYVKTSVLKKYNETYNTSYTRSYYEIEGFQEALRKFKAYDISDESNYNLQGLIIVPSRAAFARDSHYNFDNLSYRNRSFVFNFQVYKTKTRVVPAED